MFDSTCPNAPVPNSFPLVHLTGALTVGTYSNTQHIDYQRIPFDETLSEARLLRGSSESVGLLVRDSVLECCE